MALLVLTGIVIQMIDDRMSPATAKTILQGSADPLNSAFHLTYNMVTFSISLTSHLLIYE